MGKKTAVKLSPGELELLDVLWNHGPRTIAEVHRTFTERGRSIGYPTVQTRLNRLVDKGLVRKNGQYPAQYEALLKPGEMSGRYLDLIDNLCGGNLTPLMVHLADKRDLQPSELDVLRKIIAEHEKKEKKNERL